MAYPGCGLMGAYPETGMEMGSAVIIVCSSRCYEGLWQMAEYE